MFESLCTCIYFIVLETIACLFSNEGKGRPGIDKFKTKFNTFTATTLIKSISHCQAYMWYMIVIDLFLNLLIIIFLDICTGKELSTLKNLIYNTGELPLKLLSITRDIPVYP